MDTAEQSEKRYRFRRSFCNQLMESEWMVDVPEKLATDWLLVPVPEGRRAFLVASGGTTSHFSRSGHYINSFPSLLPGGCRKNAGKYGEAITFLDCIYVQIEATYYVLDVMIWNDFSYYECDTEFRRFWIKSKVSENPELTEKSRINPYMFKELEASPCDSESLKATLLDKKLNFDPLPLDGLLFYHKKVNYLPGSTPLVGWLKGYMVPEVLGTPVSEELMRQKPNSYASMKNYIQSYAEEELKKPRSRKNQKDDMDDLDSTLVPDPDDINKDSSENKTEMELKTK
jgi:snurportin-1